MAIGIENMLSKMSFEDVFPLVFVCGFRFCLASCGGLALYLESDGVKEAVLAPVESTRFP